MKTVSTLCATSTVGVAAVGYTFGRPRFESAGLQLPSLGTTAISGSTQVLNTATTASTASDQTVALNSSTATSAPPQANGPTISFSPDTSVSSDSTSKKRKWFRRMSESLSIATATPDEKKNALKRARTGTISDLTRRFSSVGFSARPNVAGNKLAKRSNSKKGGVAGADDDRPNTFGPSRSRRGTRTSLFASSFFGSGRNTPAPDDGDTRSPKSEPAENWRSYFQPKRSDFYDPDNRASGFTSYIRRITPNTRYLPTLILAKDIGVPYDEGDNVSESVGGSDSAYCDSRPLSPEDEPELVNLTRRSLSISGMLSSSVRFGRGSNASRRRRVSPSNLNPTLPTPLPTPDEDLQSPRGTQQLPQIPITTPMVGYIRAVASSTANSFELGDDMDVDANASNLEEELSSTPRPRGLSMLASDQASTLVGADETDVDFQSETVFDSLRTRASPTHPRVDSIFKNTPDGSSASPTQCLQPSSPLSINTSQPSKNISPLSQRSIRSESAPGENRLPSITKTGNLEPGISIVTSAFIDPDEDARWSSDWDSKSSPPSKREQEAPHRSSFQSDRKSATYPRRKANKRSNSNLDVFSTDKDVSPETSGNDGNDDNEVDMLDWDADDSSDSGLAQRITLEPESPTQANRSRRRAPSMHIRSKSMPVSGPFAEGTRGDPSENWDDDFDDSFAGDVIVPMAIKNAQSTLIGHLEQVKAFAALVETLKKLCANSADAGIRHGSAKTLWDEAEGIIEFATVNDEEPSSSAFRNSNGSGLNMDAFDEMSRSSSEEHLGNLRRGRRASVLLDDDIFGGVSSFSDKTKSRSPMPRTSPPPKPPLIDNAFVPGFDPITPTQALMARLQQRSRADSPIASRSSSAAHPKPPTSEPKMHFDTTNLADLVSHSEGLIHQLQDVLAAAARKKNLDEEALLQKELSKFQETWGHFIEDDDTAGSNTSASFDGTSEATTEQSGGSSSMGRRNRQKRRSSLMVFV